MSTQANPLLAPWATPFGMPPFESIAAKHFEEAFEAGFAQHNGEIQAISDASTEPDFDNTMLSLEQSGSLLRKVGLVFHNLTSSHTNDDLKAIERKMAPRLAAHYAAMFLNERVFRRIDALYQARAGLSLQPDQLRLIERYHLDFVRSGAKLKGEERRQFALNAERLAQCFTRFTQNLLADEADFCLVLCREDELAGLPEFVRASGRQLAKDRGLTQSNAHAITLARSSLTPFMAFSERRDLRQQLWQAWCSRGENHGDSNNHQVMREILELRLAQARLLGYANFSDFALADTMAGSAKAARDLLMKVWHPARERALQEWQTLVSRSGLSDFAAWDWHYWSERVRRDAYDLDDAQIRPYLQLHQLTQAMFYVANRLFGLHFKAVDKVARYHPCVQGWEVTDAQGQHVGLFLTDNFARSSKRSGAWMSFYRESFDLDQNVRPIVVNNNNFSVGPSGEPTLLSLDDARTLFHEFGHGLHGLLSTVRYPRLSGTKVLRDFVEFPSQVFEHWLLEVEVLQRFAVHAKTGEPMPAELMQRMISAQTFNQGFKTVEYIASALVDLALHEDASPSDIDFAAFESKVLSSIGMPAAIGMRHRLPHFSHIFSSNGYASAYYVYLWAEVLDADGFNAFLEAGDIFAPDLAKRLKDHIYAAGNSTAPMDAYTAFRGRAPSVEALLEKRGLQAA